MKSCVHFIGIDDSQFQSAVKVWGKPDFIHKWFDRRSLGDIDDDVDVIVFGTKTKLIPSQWTWQDHELN